MKRICYVVPMDEMIKTIRLAALEEILVNMAYPSKIKPWIDDTVESSIKKESWIRSAMSDKSIQETVWWIELQLFARLIRDIYLVESLNIVEDNIVFDFRNRLRHLHSINEETLFSSIFRNYLKFHDLPIHIRLGYNGLSLFLET